MSEDTKAKPKPVRRKVPFLPDDGGDHHRRKKSNGGVGVDHNGVLIDIGMDVEDYFSIRELLKSFGLTDTDDEIQRHVRAMVELHTGKSCSDSQSGRVRKLRMPYHIHGLPSSIVIASLPPNYFLGRLTHLESLDLSHTGLKDLSTSGLQHLKDLNLSHTHQLLSLPETIGDLTRLQQLNLGSSKIGGLPASIGKLTNLRGLDLSYTAELSSLPEAIGDLTTLQQLNLGSSKIGGLPASIGKLTNLRGLDLSYTAELSSLPEAIGDLSNLQKLNLGSSKIRGLPASIGKLESLQELDLSDTVELSSLPETIGDLVGMKLLDLDGSAILERVSEEPKDSHCLGYNSTILWRLSKNSKRLSFLGKTMDAKVPWKITDNVACNKSIHAVELIPKLWPRVLFYHDQREFEINYQLLLEGSGLFVLVLLQDIDDLTQLQS